jgi:UDP-galactopyranose mutase
MFNNNFDVLVVGCGFAGAVAARRFAEQGKLIQIIEKRPHIAGNMYDCSDTNGVVIHLYGPHIFHTKNAMVFEFLKRFSEWIPYEHRVLGSIDGKTVPIPFNFTSLEALFSSDKAQQIKSIIAIEFKGRQKLSVLELLNSENKAIKEFGEFVYSKVFINYTAKQWGVPPEQVDKTVINRVPVFLGYDDRYFLDDTIQFMPKNGYTQLFENLLNHPNISIELCSDAVNKIKIDTGENSVYFCGELFEKPIIYTGAIDELLKYKFGALPYRSLDLCFSQYKMDSFQPAAVVNYPNEHEYTRITEFKHLTGQILPGNTTILKEYPLQYNINAKKGNIPYYPIENQANISQYQKYTESIKNIENLKLCGRLSEYKYYNMDAVIDKALQIKI